MNGIETIGADIRSKSKAKTPKMLGRLVNIADLDKETQIRIKDNLEDFKKNGKVIYDLAEII